MKKFFLTVILCVSCFANFCFALSSEEILKKVDDIRSPQGSFSFMIDISYKRNNKETLQKIEVLVGDASKTLIKFVYPPTDKGKCLLMNGDNLWFYSKTIAKPIRITPQQRLLGAVSYGDVARVVYSVDYNCKEQSNVVLNNKKLIKLILFAKAKSTTYSKVILYAEEQSNRPYKAEFYSLGDKLLKTAMFRNYALLCGAERPSVMEITDVLHPGEMSTLTYSKYETKSIPASYFEKDYMVNIE